MSVSGNGKESLAFTSLTIIKLFAQSSEEFTMPGMNTDLWNLHD
jgi:hypothetical protein